MVANRANLGSLLTDHDMAAIGALPNGVLVTGEDHGLFDLAEKLAIALLMGFLNGADFLEKSSDLIETLFLSGLGETVIHVSPLEILTVSGVSEVNLGRRNRTAMEELEPNLGMLLLIFGCFLENLAYLDISVLLSPGGIIEILGVGLAFRR